MNCMEAKALVEDALDDSLAGCRKRALELHLSRCDDCRAFFAAEREEHRRWFQAMNERNARRHLPKDFADEFVAGILRERTAPQRRWTLFAKIRRVAAVLLAALFFAGLSYATAVVVNKAIETHGEKESIATEETEATRSGRAEDSSFGPAASDAPSSPSIHSDSELSTSPTEGESTVKKGRAAAAALTAAMAASPLAAADGDEYQFIDPATYPAANVSHSASSDAIMLTAGAVPAFGGSDDLEARSRSSDSSVAIALNTTKPQATMIVIK
ncbi:MAG: zf-HC2 domain-containing protein [Kiritimatiellae bacterium]|nr:zf-HC2 domain-containing protein [Kiritimatiellia bacterium]